MSRSYSERQRAVLHRLRTLAADSWLRCSGCELLVLADRVRQRHGVCPHCGAYSRLCAADRLDQLLDPGTFVEREADLTPGDPYRFVDRLPYPDRLRKAQSGTGLREAVVVGTGDVDGHRIALAVLDFAFLGGSMGSVVGEKIARIAEYALSQRIPLVTVAASGGARMQEGALSLFQMAKTAAAIAALREAGVPYLSVLTDPVYGGVAASFAALGDIIVAEAGARAGFAGPHVIKQTIGQQLPAGFQTADFLREHGHIDRVATRWELRTLLARLVAFGAAERRPPTPPRVSRHLRVHPRTVDAWEAVRLARTAGRPTVHAYIDRLFTGFVELHGDRWSGDDSALVGGLAWLDRQPIVVVGTCKGTSTAENVRRNFGMPHPHGYRKAMRLFDLAERLGVPVVTLVDTPGAYPGVRAEQGNQSGAIATALAQLARLRVPVVSVVTGEGGSGGALALVAGDRLLMQENAILSVISPEGCATILFGDASRAPEAARALRLQAAELYRMGLVDDLVAEPPGGSHTDPDGAAELIAAALRRHLAALLAVAPPVLVQRRQQRLRRPGQLPDPRQLAVARTAQLAKETAGV